MGAQESTRQHMETIVNRLCLASFRMVVLSLSAATTLAAEHIVCATAEEGCKYSGNRALQQAIDGAADGDTIVVRAGTYVSEGFHDAPYEDIVARGYVLIEGKDLSIIGESGAVLEGGAGDRASAIVISNGNVNVANLVIRDFRPDLTDDDLYDGHGIFVIDANVRISSVTFERIEKMAVSLRGHSTVLLEDSQLLNGHVGTWTEEEAKLEVHDCLFRGNDSAGIAAYASSTVTVSGSTFEANLDDGVYAAEDASIKVVNSTFIRNRPYAARSVDGAQIQIITSEFEDNAADRYPASE